MEATDWPSRRGNGFVADKIGFKAYVARTGGYAGQNRKLRKESVPVTPSEEFERAPRRWRPRRTTRGKGFPENVFSFRQLHDIRGRARSNVADGQVF